MNDKIIQFPGSDERKGKAASPKAPSPTKVNSTPSADQLQQAQTVLSGLSADQQKAMQIIMGGMPFVLVGIKPTPSGADFFTALHGDDADLRNAQDHLSGVIERAYSRRGI